MEENFEDIQKLIENLNKIENLIDRIITNEDFETLPSILEERKKLLEKMVKYASSQSIQDRIDIMLKDDERRMNKMQTEMKKIKNQLKTTNTGKKAIKHGYMKIQEEFSRRRFNSNG
ncbi:MAG: hypothetical protein B6I29_02230 [Marinitoga sp. 4572_148]|nr:MAG: hypothetical protein B6I29_02230 [Marinitoga sp. 4572_148]